MVSGTSLSIEQQQPIVARPVWRLGKRLGKTAGEKRSEGSTRRGGTWQILTKARNVDRSVVSVDGEAAIARGDCCVPALDQLVVRQALSHHEGVDQVLVHLESGLQQLELVLLVQTQLPLLRLIEGQ